MELIIYFFLKKMMLFCNSFFVSFVQGIQRCKRIFGEITFNNFQTNEMIGHRIN